MPVSGVSSEKGGAEIVWQTAGIVTVPAAV